MELQHVILKIAVADKLPVDPARFIELFHGWIREEALPALLIDVADYRHVPNGPGVVLIGHEADYSMDHAGGVWGLRYNRKKTVVGSNADRLRHAFGQLGAACKLMEEAFAVDGLRFNRDAFELLINDRATAPNTPETLAAVQPEVESFLRDALGQTKVTIQHHADPRSRFGLTVSLGASVDLNALTAKP